MNPPIHTHLSRRESQIMDIIYRLGEASVAEVVRLMPDDPAYNSVRVTLGILEKKGYLKHRTDGPRYIYAPVVSPEKAERNAMSHLLRTFYSSAPSRAVLTLLDLSSTRLSKDDLSEIEEWIKQAKQESQSD